MADKPSEIARRKAALEDTSHLVEETWTRILRNLAAIFIIGILVWGFCSVMRSGVEYGTTFLFEPFQKASEHQTDIGITSPDEDTQTSPTVLSWIQTFNPPVNAPWTLLAVLVAGGIIRGIMIRSSSWKDYEGDGAGQSIQYFIETYQKADQDSDPVEQRYKRPTFSSAVKRIIMTLLTLGTGGSGGIEGPVIPVGESLGSGISRMFKNDNPDDLRVLQMAGIAAALTTLLNVPFAAAVFAGEVVFTDRLIYRTLFYSLIASVVAYYLNNHFLAFEPLFNVAPHPPAYSFNAYLTASLTAIFISMPAAMGLQLLFKRINKLLEFIPISLRAAFGALCAGLLALLMWYTLDVEPQHVLGMGEGTLKDLMVSDDPMFQIWWLLLLIAFVKILTTGFTLMSGGSAGLLIPATFIGGMCGAGIYHGLTDLVGPFLPDPSLFVVAGVSSALVSIIEIPLATIAFIIEVFGAHFAAPAVIATVASHLLVKRFKLY